MRVVHIYCLKNPISNEVFYIGKTKGLFNRLVYHIREAGKNSSLKDKIIKELERIGVSPVIEKIETVNNIQAVEREKHWIDYYKNKIGISNIQYGTPTELINDNINRLLSEKLIPIKCLYCDQEFVPKTKRAKFCSDLHRVYWNRENKKDATNNVADKKAEIKKPESNGKHKLWKEGDPAEYSTRFYFKYNCDTYEELNQLLNQKK